MYNRVILMGRLTKDPEMRTSQNGSNFCRFSIAVDRSFAKQGEERQTDFFDITVFGQSANFVCQWFSKGRMIHVEGRLQNDNYTDKNGNKVYRTSIIADRLDFCGDKGNGGNQNGNNYSGQPGYGNQGSFGNYGNGGNGGYQNGGNGGNYGNGGYQNGGNGGNYGGGQNGGYSGNGGNGGYNGQQNPPQNQGGNSVESGDLSDFEVIGDGEVPF